jgi:phosphatidylglycerol lysyltransferase
VFDLAGIRHFKSRFRPRYENRYCCVYPKASFSSVFAFGLVSGLFNVKPWTLLKVAFRRFLKRNQRSTLAEID